MKISGPLKNFLSVLLRIGVSGGILFYLFSKIDTAAMFALLKKADFYFLYLALAIYLVINFILFLRWFVLIKGLDLRVPLSALVNYFFIGLFFNLFLPTSTGGDIIKIWGVCRFTAQKAKVVASVVLDRLCGFMAIVIVALFSFAFGARILNDPSLLIGIFVLAFVSSSIMLILFSEKLYSFGCRIFSRFPKIKNSLMDLHYDIVLLKDNPLAIVWAVLISCFAQAVLAFSWLLIARALHQNIDLLYFFIFVPIICVLSSFPSIGGLGTREAGAVYLFAKAGVFCGVAVSISLISYVLTLAIGLIGGVIYVAQLSPRRIQHRLSPAGLGPKKA